MTGPAINQQQITRAGASMGAADSEGGRQLKEVQTKLFLIKICLTQVNVIHEIYQNIFICIL